VLPEYCVRHDLADGALVRLLPQFKLPARPILVVRPRSMYMTEKVRLFVDFLAQWFKKGDLLAHRTTVHQQVASE
jgi:DNA-binding transcriptional LysR family regulator